MIHTYKITGMTCSGCEATVKSSLLKLPDVESIELSKDTGIATIGMSKHISVSDLQNAIGVNSKYHISEDNNHPDSYRQSEVSKGWLATYKPLLILFGLILSVSFIATLNNGALHPVIWMRYFMAGFFLCFSYFKLINVKGFADSYSMYDIVAKKIKPWGFIYPFVELALGIAYVLDFNPLVTNIVTVVIMGISSIGVIESVVNKKKIQCACLGAVFNLPMSTVTIIEDLLMVVMAGVMIYIS
jgi:copper chaperone CopZ